MSDELREKVAEIFTKAEYGFPFNSLIDHCRERMLNSTDAAIAIIWNAALEEAAKAVETCRYGTEAATILALKDNPNG